ncbi:melanoma-associated antigen 8-like [Equus quagga]|uniref:melanoma-associated antigen 8-like n=1 Tax=Equus quagga TaxID=89248 RepID=UPI001EE2490E|nr:melanoma-associated antigen 8-like [Equus quagga]
MTLGRMGELCKREEDHQDPREAQGLVDAQLSGAEEEEAISPSSSPSVPFLGTLEEVAAAVTPSPDQGSQSAWPSPTAMAATPWSQYGDNGSSSQDEEGPSAWEDPGETDSSLQDALRLKVTDLVGFLLLKYRTKEPTTKAEMLNTVLRDYQDHFPVIFSEASECMQLVFGIDVKEVDPSDHSYVLVTTLGLTYDGMLRGEQSMPKTGLLVMLLGVILLQGDCAPEEDVWEALSVMGVRAGREHFIYGEPRELITKVWVQEQYVEYWQVPSSDPARYEFLWGPRAHAETSKMKVLEYLLRVSSRDPSPFLHLCGEAVSDEEEAPEPEGSQAWSRPTSSSFSCWA